MRITFRLIISLVVAVASVASIFVYVQVRQERRGMEEELERRARLLAESLEETIEPLMVSEKRLALQRFVNRFGNRERLVGMAVYNVKGIQLAATASLTKAPPDMPEWVDGALAKGVDAVNLSSMAGQASHFYTFPLRRPDGIVGCLVIAHEAGHIQTKIAEIWNRNFFRILAQVILITLITLLIIRWNIVSPVVKMAEWMKQLRAGEAAASPMFPKGDLFDPLAREVTRFAKHLEVAKAAAEEEAKLRQAGESLWTPDRLKEHIRAKLKDQPLIVISNREPYMHQRVGRKVEVIVPAGGLVTALDPVLRASNGTWIAHGAGDADWTMVDDRQRLKVPPEDPRYTLRRVLLTQEEEEGYYYGFSNEGLWPLCHIAHTRPIFRPTDWAAYQQANQKFAEAALDELVGVKDPCVLIQDYHFALLPRMLKEARPDARIAIFWHTPWPNPEAFGICPWQKEILHGMLGADLVGFHTQFHCNNFLDTVDRTLECRIDWEHFTVEREGHLTHVKPFPISVHFQNGHGESGTASPSRVDPSTLLKELGLQATHLAIGVDRVDYTKGLLEKFRAVERLLEKHPKYVKAFTLVQMGAPSRTHIKRYHDFLAEVEAEAERINWKFKAKEWKPIVFLKGHHHHREILPWYQAADVCLVTSLHDGMNLVAKEFVASREDEGGALVLSRFAGASRDLRDALIVNPYDVDQTADAIRYALEMDLDERAARMQKMRETVRENNIYRWAGTLIEELSRIRLDRTLTAHRM